MHAGVIVAVLLPVLASAAGAQLEVLAPILDGDGWVMTKVGAR